MYKSNCRNIKIGKMRNIIHVRVCALIVKGDEILYNYPKWSAHGINSQSVEKHLKFCNNKPKRIV